MDTQVSLRLPKQLAKEIEWVSQKIQRKRSEIIRIALEEFLKSKTNIFTNNKPIDAVRDIIGCFGSGVNDLGEKHREYLTKIIKHGR